MDPTQPPTKLQRLVRKALTGFICHPRVRSLILRMHKQKYAGGRKTGRLSFFFAFDDPYLPLIVDQVAALSRHYRVEVEWIPLATAYSPADPQSAMRKQYMLQDANREARLKGGREFNTTPDVDRHQTLTLLAAALPPETLADWVPQAVKHLWHDEPAPVANTNADTSRSAATLLQNEQERDRLGHYEAGMIKFDFDWYWAYGRLDFLTERLTQVGLGGSMR